MIDRRQAELIAVMIAYFAVYAAVIGPAIGAATGFERSALVVSSRRGGTLLRMLSSVRGWILILGFGPVVFSYALLRARLAGVHPKEMWDR
jgi:hypothetical protein